MESADTWQWIWLVAALAFALGEMSTAGSFFLLPFALGAAAATALAFLDATLGWQWLSFLAVSGVTFAALRPLAARLDRDLGSLSGIGADRWTGRRGVVLADIPGGTHELGMVRVDREEWRAESADGRAIPTGTPVEVVQVEGTRVIVRPRADDTEIEEMS